jgi:hypothetical protein
MPVGARQGIVSISPIIRSLGTAREPGLFFEHNQEKFIVSNNTADLAKLGYKRVAAMAGLRERAGDCVAAAGTVLPEVWL